MEPLETFILLHLDKQMQKNKIKLNAQNVFAVWCGKSIQLSKEHILY